MSSFVIIGNQAFPLALRRQPDGTYTRPDSTPICLTETALGKTISAGDQKAPIDILQHGDDIWVHLLGRTYRLTWQSSVNHYGEEAHADTSDIAQAPMPGAVVTISVQPGDQVQAGQTMLIIESMKLETAIKSPRAGTVEAVHVVTGQTFERGATLVTLAKDTV